ncbi:hypothetical protein LCGC14_2524010 [marine sediment metagenome]|uniref:DUF4326 domain-containing protein n=1 Tax=marine sediment metagenome TaxID=412755 RepID=A0A0F9AVY6_9ZZZZ
MKNSGTCVVNLRTSAYDVYIGRPGKWGNPFVIGAMHQDHVLTRETCIAAFEDWLRHSDKGVALQADLGELRGKRLGCYCKPQACHGDVLVELIEELGV